MSVCVSCWTDTWVKSNAGCPPGAKNVSSCDSVSKSRECWRCTSPIMQKQFIHGAAVVFFQIVFIKTKWLPSDQKRISDLVDIGCYIRYLARASTPPLSLFFASFPWIKYKHSTTTKDINILPVWIWVSIIYFITKIKHLPVLTRPPPSPRTFSRRYAHALRLFRYTIK